MKLPLNRIIEIAGLCIGIILLSTSCCRRDNSGKAAFTVSISPLKYVVGAITGDDFEIRVLVPDGASPETYSPTSQQMIDVEKASLVFTTGLIDFEKELVKKISNSLDNNNIVDLSEGIALIAGHSHSHSHHHGGDAYSHDGHDDALGAAEDGPMGSQGVDPHIWTSPEQLKTISTNAYRAIMGHYPDSTKYTAAYHRLMEELDEVSVEVQTKIADSGVKYFIIYHPAFTYYARDYGIEQISLEDEGKEPSAVYMRSIADRGRHDRVKQIFYERQFPQAAVETLAADIGATPVAVDPLAEDIVGQILYITDVISGR